MPGWVGQRLKKTKRTPGLTLRVFRVRYRLNHSLKMSTAFLVFLRVCKYSLTHSNEFNTHYTTESSHKYNDAIEP